RVAGEERFERAERLIHRGGASALIAARLIPIMPFSLMGSVCGAARVPLVRFTWTTAVGYIPITAYFTYLGSQLEGFSIGDPIVWIGGGLLILLIFAARFVLPRGEPEDAPRSKDETPRSDPEPDRT